MIEQINQDITIPSDPPSSRDRVNFRLRADDFVAWMKNFATEIKSLIPKINTALEWININVQNALTYSQTATTKAELATTKAGEASASAAAAYDAQLAVESIFDNFDDKYLGAKATAPTVDNDGNPLVTGALYFKTTAPKGLYIYDAELVIWSSPTYVPTSHGSLSGRSDVDSHPMSAITGLLETLESKATLESPALTGTPTAPTPTAGDKSTKVATTAFVMNNPCFSAYRSSTQPISSSTWTKVQFNAEDYDPNNKYDSTTNFRFQPDVAGYYDLNSAINIQATNMTAGGIALYKNGSIAKMLDFSRFAATSLDINIHGSSDLYLNGSTDYAEIYVQIVGTSPVINSGSPYTNFSAKFSRS